MPPPEHRHLDDLEVGYLPQPVIPENVLVFCESACYYPYRVTSGGDGMAGLHDHDIMCPSDHQTLVVCVNYREFLCQSCFLRIMMDMIPYDFSKKNEAL